MLVAIFNAWDHDLLRKAVDNIKKSVDEVIIVWSQYSNHGYFMPFDRSQFSDCKLINCEPKEGERVHDNERYKRNTGLEYAKRLGADYFLMMDCDEFYHEEDVKNSLEFLKGRDDLKGLVCKSIVYFKEPTLTVGEDVTYVTFIHKLTPDLHFVETKDYPYTTHQGKLRIDPTRRLNIKDGVMFLPEVYMHHYSYVRKDIDIKINNSSSFRLKQSTAKLDWTHAKEGTYVGLYQTTLKKCPDYFNITGYEQQTNAIPEENTGR